MQFFWQISGEIANWMIRKTGAAGTRIWPAKGHYMGLNFCVFWQIKAHTGTKFWVGESDDIPGPNLSMDRY